MDEWRYVMVPQLKKIADGRNDTAFVLSSFTVGFGIISMIQKKVRADEQKKLKKKRNKYHKISTLSNSSIFRPSIPFVHSQIRSAFVDCFAILTSSTSSPLTPPPRSSQLYFPLVTSPNPSTLYSKLQPALHVYLSNYKSYKLEQKQQLEKYAIQGWRSIVTVVPEFEKSRDLEPWRSNLDRKKQQMEQDKQNKDALKIEEAQSRKETKLLRKFGSKAISQQIAAKKREMRSELVLQWAQQRKTATLIKLAQNWKLERSRIVARRNEKEHAKLLKKLAWEELQRHWEAKKAEYQRKKLEWEQKQLEWEKTKVQWEAKEKGLGRAKGI